MATVTETRTVTNRKTAKPITVELTLAINGQFYGVEAIAPGPDNVKAFRLAKQASEETVYDVCQTTAGLVECDCQSFESTYRGNGLETCKHGRALIMVGLVDYPAVQERIPEPSAPVAPAFDRSIYRAQNAVAEGRATWLAHRDLHTSEALPPRRADFLISENAPEPRLVDDDGTPLETPAEMDRRHRDEHAALVAVSELRADWVSEKPVAPCCPDDEIMPCRECRTFEGPADLSDGGWDDEWRWEITPDAETDPEVLQLIEDGAYEEGEGDAPLADATPECFAAIAEGRAEWRREFGLVPCPGWVTKENRDWLMADEAIGDEWASPISRDFAERMRARKAAMLAPAVEPEPRSLELQVRDHARSLRAEGSPLGDLLAERAESLADQIAFLEATTVEQFRDRLDCMLDCAALEAERGDR